MKFGDEIDWNAEARRAAREDAPGAAPGELVTRLAKALKGRVQGIVDCGCNIARFYPSVTAAGLLYVGVDQATDALNIARSRYPFAVLLQAMLWENWPLQVGIPVGGAFCNAVLQHNTHPEKEQILARVAQAVPIGGAFAMQESTVPAQTKTQLQQGQWIALVERFGFELQELWHPNDEYGILDGYLFKRVMK